MHGPLLCRLLQPEAYVGLNSEALSLFSVKEDMVEDLVRAARASSECREEVAFTRRNATRVHRSTRCERLEHFEDLQHGHFRVVYHCD